MAAERRRQKEILRRRAMRRYYAFWRCWVRWRWQPWWGLFFLIKAAADWARAGRLRPSARRRAFQPPRRPHPSGEPAADPNAPQTPRCGA